MAQMITQLQAQMHGQAAPPSASHPLPQWASLPPGVPASSAAGAMPPSLMVASARGSMDVHDEEGPRSRTGGDVVGADIMATP
eukprot:12732032-Alexandrium_andersonii.AAC.1